MKLSDLFEAGPPIDNVRGLGAVGASSNIDYLGLRVMVKPSVFLKLATPHPDPRSDYIEQHIAAGEPIGAPFLDIHIPQEWFSDETDYKQVVEGDLSKPARIVGHEGRHRMTAILKHYGDEPIETHILLSGLRRRHLTDNMIKRLNESIVSQTRKLVKGPWFELAATNEHTSALSEIFNKPYDLPKRWVNDTEGGYFKEITLPSNKLLTIKIDWDPYDKIAIWNFWVDDDQDITGGGDAVRIFSTAITAFQQFVKSRKPTIIAFMGNDLDASRIKLYDTLVQWLIKKGQLTDYRDITDNSDYWPDELFWFFDERYDMDGKIYVLAHKRYKPKPVDSIDENFADGKGPGRPGDSRRHGIPKGATLAQLDKIGKGKGRKAQLARWQANMRRGRKRATNEAIAPHGSPENEFEMMKAGTKPAALVNPQIFQELYKPVADQLGWPYQQLKIADHKYNNYVVGQPGEEKRVQRLAMLVQDMNANFALGIKPDKEYHIEMGRLLGYSDQDIRDFLKKINLAESQTASGAALTVFDIDETLFHTKAKILVVKDGKVVKELDNREFNTYTLEPGESFDFRQFRDAKFFNATSVPIEKMWQKAKSTLDKVGRRPGSKVIIVTARSDFDDRETFLDTFRKHGLDIDKIHVHRAGNLNLPSGEAKKIIIGQYLETGEFNMVRLFDDAEVNLKSFLSLKQDYPNIKFKAYMVLEDGSVREYNS